MLKKTLIASLAALLTTGLTHAQDGALLDLLVKKKIVTAREAEDVRADLVKEQASTSAGKIVVGSWVQEMKLGGDLRLRYQYDSRDFQVDPAGAGGDKDRSPSGAQRSRWRFRLRLRDEFKLNDNWFGGVELSTSQAADSGNQTFGEPGAGAGFGKYGIFISRAYLGWNASDWLTVVAGKQANPFYTTDLVWDPDINPDGLTESVRFHKMYFGGESGGSDAKDGKTSETVREERPWELTLNLGQFIFADNLENGGINTEPGFVDNDISNDAYMFVAQLLGTYKVRPGVKVTFAPGVMFFNSSTLFGLNNENLFQDGAALPAAGASRLTSFTGSTRKETIITAPGDISFKLGSIPTKLYWDFAWNAQGEGRADDIYGLVRALPPSAGNPTKPRFDSLHETSDDFAYLIGVQLGENKKKGDLSANVNWRQTGLTSVEPNLNDSDFALGELNTRGIKTGVVYNLTDFATFAVTYQYAWNLRDSFLGATGPANGGPGTSGGVADANVVHVLQVDLSMKF